MNMYFHPLRVTDYWALHSNKKNPKKYTDFYFFHLKIVVIWFSPLPQKNPYFFLKEEEMVGFV